MKKSILFIIPLLLSIAVTNAQNALDFDGSDDFVLIPHSSSLSSFTDQTIEFWVKPDQVGWKSYVTTTHEYWTVTTDGSGRIDYRMNAANKYGTGIVQVGVWQHVAVVVNGATNTINFYIDGIDAGEVTGIPAITNIPSNHNVGLGGESLGPLGNFPNGGNSPGGLMDEVRIWNVVRSQSEIMANMDAEIDPATPGLVAYYTFNQGLAGGNNSGISTLTDATSNGNDGVLYNFALDGSSSNWVSGYDLSAGSTYDFYPIACGDLTDPTTGQTSTVSSNDTLTYTVTDISTGSDGEDSISNFHITQYGNNSPYCATCGYPTSLAAVAGSEGVIDVSWNAWNGENTYKVQWKKVGSSIWNSATASGTSFAITGLKEQTEYVVQVRTFCDGNGASGYAPAVTATTSANSCGIPAGLTTKNVTSTGITLDWDAEVGADAYKVRYKGTQSSTWQVITSATDEVAISGLRPGVDYEWQVRTFCPAGGTDYAPLSTFNTSSACSTPANLTNNVLGPKKVALSWDAVAGADVYKVNLLYSGSWRYYRTATNSITIGALRAGGYSAQVKAICATGYSAWSQTSFVLGVARFGEFSNEIDELEVYPNPASDYVTVAVPEYQVGGTLELMNANGMTVETLSIDANRVELNVSDYASGVYMVKIASNHGVEMKQIVIE